MVSLYCGPSLLFLHSTKVHCDCITLAKETERYFSWPLFGLPQNFPYFFAAARQRACFLLGIPSNLFNFYPLSRILGQPFIVIKTCASVKTTAPCYYLSPCTLGL